MAHQASWIKAKGSDVELGTADTPTPGPSELLIKVECIAFSPIEFKMQKFEVHPTKYPNILGFSFAGTVENVGPDVEGFAVGDRIATGRPEHTLDDPGYGSFQQYALAAVDSTTKLPPDVSLAAAAASILNLATVAGALSVQAGLHRPDLHTPVHPRGEKVLIYGGSSSCGGLAICYAKAAGYEVVTTSSQKNKDYVTSLGPDTIIDHTQSEAALVADLSANGPYHTIFDTIGSPAVTNVIVNYLSELGGGSYQTLQPVLPGTKPIPDNIDRQFASYGYIFYTPEHEDFRKWFNEELMPVGLSSGIIVPTPQKKLHGGLEHVQHALDLMQSGSVSAGKLIVDPWESA